jgi:Tol biopolymer transport system component/DNA-binding winged helix-turn-helix (wHTH) protein
MGASGSQGPRIRFAEFEVDLQSQELFRGDAPVRLPNQSFVALAALLERPGQLVTRDELRSRLWPDKRVVEFEQGLNAIINRLREALGDSAESPRFVETLPRRGYRFVGTLDDVASTQPTSLRPTPRESAHPTESAQPSHPVSPRIKLLAGAAISLVALAITWSARQWQQTAVPIAQGREPPADGVAAHALAPLTTLLGQEHMPALSPDGSRVLFAWEPERGQGFDLYTRPLDSERQIRLTHSSADAIAGAWAPDGTRIAFARMGDRSGLYLLESGAERKLVDASFTQEALLQPSWSPDGRTIAFSAVNGAGSHGIMLLDLGTPASRPLPRAPECWHAGAPIFSPEEGLLAFICTSSVAVYSVYLAELRGGTAPRSLARFRGWPQGLAWRDSEHLLVANDSGDGTGIWTLSVDGRLVRPGVVEESLAPGLAASAGRIVFSRARQIIDIWHLRLDDPSAGARKWIYSTRAQITPSYSPDGSRIAFQSNRSGNPEIWIADADGANAARLTSFNGPLTGAPAWCSDGRRLAFDSRESGISAIYVVDTLERVPRRVQTTQANLALPTWSADCRFLLASDGRESLYLVPAEGGEARRFTMHRSYQAAVLGERAIFNVAGPDEVTLWSKPLAGGQEERLPGMPRLTYADGWAATRGSIYFTDTSRTPVVVRRYAIDAARIETVATLPNVPTALGGLGLAVSSDGKSLLYTHTEDTQSDLVSARPR